MTKASWKLQFQTYLAVTFHQQSVASEMKSRKFWQLPEEISYSTQPQLVFWFANELKTDEEELRRRPEAVPTNHPTPGISPCPINAHPTEPKTFAHDPFDIPANSTPEMDNGLWR